MALPADVTVGDTGHTDHHDSLHVRFNNSVEFRSGTLAARPAAAAVDAGTVYWATDEDKLYRSDGASSWSALAAVSTLGGLTDVTISTPADNEILTYDLASDEWINQTAAEVGIATVADLASYATVASLADYLLIDGTREMTGDLVLPGTGKLGWSGDADSYITRAGANDLRAVVGGAIRLWLNASGVDFQGSALTNMGQVSGVDSLAIDGLTGATASSRYVGATASGAPASGTFSTGDWVIDQSGSIYICTAGGSPGTWTQVGGSAGPTVVHKTADESDGTGTLQNDDHLVFSVGANEEWIVEFQLVYTGGSSINTGLTIPTGASGYAWLASWDGGTGGGTRQTLTTLSGGSTATGSATGSGSGGIAQLRAHVIVSTTSGSVQLQWARAIGTMTMKKGSYLKAHQVA